jgi:flagellar hook-associated protein 2
LPPARSSRPARTAAPALGSYPIQALVNAYNELNNTISQLASYDPTTHQAGPGLGDSAVQTMQAEIRDLLGTSASGSATSLSMFAQIGVSFQPDGTLALDTFSLEAALANDPSTLRRLFSSLFQLNAALTRVLGSSGALVARTERINARLKDIDSQRNDLSARLAQVHKNTLAQATALDALIGSMHSTGSFLARQLASITGDPTSES